MDTKQSPTNLGLSFGGVNCLVVFTTHFNPDNSLLILLQNSLLFRCNPALINYLLITQYENIFSNISGGTAFLLQSVTEKLHLLIHSFDRSFIYFGICLIHMKTGNLDEKM